MLKPWIRWIFRSRLRTTFSLVLLVSMTVLVRYWSELCLWRAETNLARRQFNVAAQWIWRSQWLGRPNAAQLCLIQLRLARRTKNYREVETYLRQAADAGIPRRDIQRERWIAMAQTNQFNLMESHWDELLSDPRDDEPEIARSHYSWALLHHDFGLALKTLHVWHYDCPQDAEPLIIEGRFYQSIEDWEHAEEAYRSAHALAPDNDECCLYYANALLTRLKTKEAFPLFQDFLRRHPNDPPAIQGLAKCYAANGELETAIRLLDQAIQSAPDDFETQKVYGEVLLAAGQHAKAAVFLQKAHLAVPEHANLAYTLARSLAASGRGSEAEPLFEFVSESRPQLDQILELEKQLRSQPGHLELRMKIAAITAKFISRRDAIRWYENILVIAPNYSPAREAIEDLRRQLNDKTVIPNSEKVDSPQETSTPAKANTNSSTTTTPK